MSPMKLEPYELVVVRPMTVTDGASSGPRGIIHFVVVGGRVRFFIDQASAERRRLSISSRLLALALGVRQ